MDLIKKLTGKNPSEYEAVAKALVDNSDKELFAKLVKQDDFLFDFVKNNVSKRIQAVCNENNYQNLLKFFEYYSASYDSMFADVLYKFGGIELLPVIKELFLDKSDNKKAYAVKFFALVDKNLIQDVLPLLRATAKSNFEPLAINSIEVLSKLNDEVSKQEALDNLASSDEFIQYNAIKFLVTYQAKETLPQIIEIMKKSSLAENIAAEIPFLIPIEDLIKDRFEDGMLVLCNIVNAIPEIISPSAVIDYNLFSILEDLYLNNLNSASAVLLRLAKSKVEQLLENEEYLFDCDKNTKDEVQVLNNLLKGVSARKLESLLYEELYDESDFVFFAIDYVEEIGELETLLDSSNPTLVLKILSLLKEKGVLTEAHKNLAQKTITQDELKQYIEAL